MSALWHVQVLRLEDMEVDLRVCLIHPDAGAFLTEPQFALRLLYDEAWQDDEQFHSVAAGPLAEAISPEQIEDDDWLTDNAQDYIASVTLSDVQREPYDEDATQELIDEQVRAQGISQDNQSEWKRAWNSAWEAFWKDPSNLPVATYTIKVTDPRWISHLKLEQSWDSAAYA